MDLQNYIEFFRLITVCCLHSYHSHRLLSRTSVLHNPLQKLFFLWKMNFDNYTSYNNHIQWQWTVMTEWYEFKENACTVLSENWATQHSRNCKWEFKKIECHLLTNLIILQNVILQFTSVSYFYFKTKWVTYLLSCTKYTGNWQIPKTMKNTV